MSEFRLRLVLVSCLSILATACPSDGGKDSGGHSGNPDNAVPVVEIVSPADGSTYYEGDRIEFEARVTDQQSGDNLTADSVVWSANGWGGLEGRTGTVHDLGVGDWNLKVTATVGDKEASDQARITVEALEVPYRGNFQANVTVSGGGFDFSDVCTGGVDFVVRRGADMEGTGVCTLSKWGKDLQFELLGTIANNNVTGTLVMTSDGTEYETPFSGTRSQSLSIDVGFDETFQNSDGSLRLNGTFSANPV